MYEIKKYEEAVRVGDCTLLKQISLVLSSETLGKRYSNGKKAVDRKGSFLGRIFASFEKMILDCEKNSKPNNIQEKAID